MVVNFFVVVQAKKYIFILNTNYKTVVNHGETFKLYAASCKTSSVGGEGGNEKPIREVMFINFQTWRERRGVLNKAKFPTVTYVQILEEKFKIFQPWCSSITKIEINLNKSIQAKHQLINNFD